MCFRRLLVCVAITGLSAAPGVALTVSIAVDDAHVFLAQPVYYWLVYRNDSRTEKFVSADAFHAWAIQVVDPEGNRLPYTGIWARELPGPESSYRRFVAGEKVAIGRNLSQEFDLSRPGTYRISLELANERPERAMESEAYRMRAAALGAVPIEPSALERDPIVSNVATVTIERPTGTAGRVVESLMNGARPDSLRRFVYDNADRVLEEFGQSAYAPYALAVKVEKMLGEPDRGVVDRGLRFAAAARMVDELEAKYVTWHGFPYLYSRVIAEAAAKSEKAYAERWASKLRGRYPDHPATIWLANRRAETGRDRPTK